MFSRSKLLNLNRTNNLQNQILMSLSEIDVKNLGSVPARRGARFSREGVVVVPARARDAAQSTWRK